MLAFLNPALGRQEARFEPLILHIALGGFEVLKST